MYYYFIETITILSVVYFNFNYVTHKYLYIISIDYSKSRTK